MRKAFWINLLSALLFLFGRADSDCKAMVASRATDGMLALLSWQAKRGLALGAIAEHVRVGVLIAVMAAEQTANFVFKGTPFGVLGLSFIDLSGKCTRNCPNTNAQRQRIQHTRNYHAGQSFPKKPRYGQ